MKEKLCYGCMKIKLGEYVCEHCGYDETVKNESHQLPTGTILKEQYLIGKVLGQGGFGITYLGWDLYLDIPIAIKEYFPNSSVMRDVSVSTDVVSYSGDASTRFRNNKERFMREAKTLAKFSDVPEIVHVKNFFLANNTAYIVMEYVEGTNLKQVVKEHGGRLSYGEALSILKPVMEALGKVHKEGLVHRDISPDNIMLLPDGTTKLLDFGAVRDVGDADVNTPLTASTEAIIKQGYAPIEQYQNRGSLGPWTDVYALCATMYYCLTGEVPMDAPGRLLGDEEIDFGSHVDEYIAVVLKQGMELRAAERIHSVDELLEKLEADVKKVYFTSTMKTSAVNSGKEKQKDTEQKREQFDGKQHSRDLHSALYDYNNQNYAAAFPVFKKYAQADDKNAQYVLSQMYNEGYGIEKDNERAEFWLKSAADNGNIVAQFDYGMFLMQNVDTNNSKMVLGFKYLEMSAENNNKDAMIQYCEAVGKGYGDVTIAEKALSYCMKLEECAEDSFEAEKYALYEQNIKKTMCKLNMSALKTKVSNVCTICGAIILIFAGIYVFIGLDPELWSSNIILKGFPNASEKLLFPLNGIQKYLRPFLNTNCMFGLELLFFSAIFLTLGNNVYAKKETKLFRYLSVAFNCGLAVRYFYMEIPLNLVEDPIMGMQLSREFLEPTMICVLAWLLVYLTGMAIGGIVKKICAL